MAVQDRYKTFQRDQRAFFDALITEDWADYKNEEWDTVRQYEVDRIFDHVHPESILDLGCGCGFHDRYMAGFDFVSKVHGIDYSPKSIERANEEYPHAKVERWVADLEQDEPVMRYDLVVSFQVIEHLEQTDKYIDFCLRACKPGGAIAILTPNRKRLPNTLRSLRGLDPQLCDPQHFREYSLSELKQIGRDHDLRLKATFGYGLNGLRIIDKMAIERRLRFGNRIPALANGIASIFVSPAE